jgi:hypothetical protein
MDEIVKAKAIELKKEKDELETKVKKIENELKQLAKVVNTTPKYGGIIVKMVEGDKWMPECIGRECIRITEYLLNEKEKEEHLHLFGSICGGWEQYRSSVVYYRINNILLHEGGGWLLIKDKQLCNDEEWELIKKGEIPEKFWNIR